MVCGVQGASVGIDLGTTYSCIGVWQNDRVEIIANEQGHHTTPSCVAFTNSDLFTGEAAKNHTDPANTVFNVKRIIGSKFNDPVVQTNIKQWPFKVTSTTENKPQITVDFRGKTKTFHPEEISAMVLMKMKEIAEARTGVKVKNAVITVPAHFNNWQRQATKDAGAIAGFNVLRIMSEPSAAGMAFCHSIPNDRDATRNFLVFDLGGGTVDVSIVTSSCGILQVLATAGNMNLGGEDFDNCLVKFLSEEFKRKHGKDLTSCQRALYRLRTACERAKRTLSSATEAYMEIESLYDGTDFTCVITRAHFEAICNDYFRKAMEPVEKVLQDSNLAKDEIDEILLVGGSSRIPKIQQLLSDFFNGKQLNKSVNPDEAVASGATLQAALLSQINCSENLQDLLLLDTTPHSLGYTSSNSSSTTVVQHNTMLLSRTMSPNNEGGPVIQVFEGLNKTSIGAIALDKAIDADIAFDVDLNGLLDVVAVNKRTGQENKLNIIYDKGRLTADDINLLAKRLEKCFSKEDDDKLFQQAESKHARNTEKKLRSTSETSHLVKWFKRQKDNFVMPSQVIARLLSAPPYKRRWLFFMQLVMPRVARMDDVD